MILYRFLGVSKARFWTYINKSRDRTPHYRPPERLTNLPHTTMIKLLALSLVAVAMGQLFLPGRLVLDTVSGFRVEYDDNANVVLLISDRECYIVEAADATWDTLVRNHDELHTAALAIVKQIDSNTGVRHTTFREAATQYHSRLEEFQCILKSIYTVSYTPTTTSQ